MLGPGGGDGGLVDGGHGAVGVGQELRGGGDKGGGDTEIDAAGDGAS